MLSDFATVISFFASIDLSTMTVPLWWWRATRTTHVTVAGPGWRADPYLLAPSPESLLTVFGAGHGLGGVSG